MEIPIHYDPMIAKLVAHGATRNEAIDRLTKAIDSYRIRGVETTLAFGKYALNHPSFVSGNFDTHFVEENMNGYLEEQHRINEAAATFAAWLYQKQKQILVLPKMA